MQDDIDKEMKKQNDMLWKLKDELKENCDYEELKEMLTLNTQPTKGAITKLIDRCADGMLFGAIPSCPGESFQR